MTPVEIAELRNVSESHSAAGCSKSRQILWLLDKHDEQSYTDEGVQVIVNDALAAEAKCRAKDATILALSEKLRICSDTITKLAERCAAQSELLGRRAERESS